MKNEINELVKKYDEIKKEVLIFVFQIIMELK